MLIHYYSMRSSAMVWNKPKLALMGEKHGETSAEEPQE